MQKFDVLIVGAGIVGLTLALALRKTTELKIAIADTQPIKAVTPEPEVRVSAINMASQTLFENLNVWPDITENRLLPYQKMHIWDKGGLGKLDFSLNDLGHFLQHENLGWIIENNVIRNALWKKAQADEEVRFFTDHTLASITEGDSEVFVSFDDSLAASKGSQTPLIAKLVIGADGANSWVRQQIAIPMITRDYDHHAIVATIKCSQGHKNTAWQVFLPSGPLAFLPLFPQDNATCSIVYSTSPKEAKRLTALNAIDFAKELTAASDGKLGNIELVSERFTYPLTMRLAQDFVKGRVVLIGDAAHTVLKAFSRARKSEATEMIAAMEAIKQTFSLQQPGVKLFRGIGLSLLDNVKPAKKILIEKALGLKSDLPELAQRKLN